MHHESGLVLEFYNLGLGVGLSTVYERYLPNPLPSFNLTPTYRKISKPFYRWYLYTDLLENNSIISENLFFFPGPRVNFLF